ncbi:LacI family DNA-binding transcriptional regulator [Serratia inhibens]|uniref:LacI family DNA-binding transcriptional regulator n=1 Tax=Serratia inhibens TaxID=2338073 RepID=UPI00080942E4|nr:LacI family DNA-binding transcriptional regulator [Serratia inhibens]ANS43754.1 Lactose operon repressor [Serratia inhibens PRI-2C]
MNKRQATLEDVAKQAGVSQQTVSRVLNNPDIVSERTRNNVLGAMNTLNYVPNRSAQILAGKTLPTFGLLTTSLALHAPSQIASSFKHHAESVGYQVAISMLKTGQLNVLQSALNEFRAQKINSVVMSLPLEKADAETLARDNPDIRQLFLDVPPAAEVCHLGFLHSDGTASSVNLLLELGHRKFGLLAGPESSISARLRLACWRDTLYQAGIAETDTEYGDWSANSGWVKTVELFSRHPDITAMLVASDQMALGVISALRQLNKRIPQDVSVIGYDDTPDSQYFHPALTTVRQDFDLIGKRAVTHLLSMENQPQEAFNDLLPTTLVIRQSTGKPDAAGSESALVRQLKALVQQL